MSHQPIADWDKGVKAIGAAFESKATGSLVPAHGSATFPAGDVRDLDSCLPPEKVSPTIQVQPQAPNLPPAGHPLRFAPGQHESYIDLILVDTEAEVCGYAGHHADDTKAFFCFEHESGARYGYIMLARETLKRSILVHEITHAAMVFIANYSMTSDAVMAMCDAEKEEYYEEACARVAEALYEQAEAFLWPNEKLSHTAPTTT